MSKLEERESRRGIHRWRHDRRAGDTGGRRRQSWSAEGGSGAEEADQPVDAAEFV